MGKKISGPDKEQFYKTLNMKFNKCLCPTLDCPNEAIRAHSVQKATALALIEEDGHVVKIGMDFKNDRPRCVLERVGRQNASTFTGLCGKHDTEIFLPIDTKPLDSSDPEQLFLLAYRSATRELHAALQGAARLQATYLYQIRKGIVSESKPSVAAWGATQAFYKAWIIWRYRMTHYDLPLDRGLYHGILHSKFTIKNRAPLIAASAFFAVNDSVLELNCTIIALNIVPISSDETLVIFSYPKSHSGIARRRISSVMTKIGFDQEIALSTLILDATENFFIRPSHCDDWGEDKRNMIAKVYGSTIMQGTHLKAESALNLF